jgi:D-sedoheptulose 7-phosphate isomerase
MTDPETELERHLEVVAAARALLPALSAVGEAMIAALGAGGRIWTFGNGGSAAEAQHFATELAGRYRRARRPLAAVALTADSTLITCIGNDYSFDDVFARQVGAVVSAGDVVVAFTTSGESENVVRGMAAARNAGATTVLLSGESGSGGSSAGRSGGSGGSGGRARDHADHALVIPASETARVQEVHLLFLHLLSEQIDAWAAG